MAGTEITAVFAEDGTLSGSAGCNNYTTTYTVDGDNITIGMGASTMMFCAEPEGVMDQEAQYLAALETAATYTITGDKLELRTADGALAVSYAAAGEAVVAAPADTGVSDQLSEVLTELRALTGTVKEQQQRLARLEKRFGLPNSSPSGERPGRTEPEDVGWPLDLNRPFDRESVDKGISFHDV